MIKKENIFYILLILTIIVTRLSVFLIPEVDINLFGFIVHHFWFGVILVLIGLVVPKKYDWAKIVFYAIGLGLIVDQLVFIILGAGKDAQYWALPSLLGTIILTLIILPFRAKISNWLLKY
jgi:peptidoglycan/LPS O-acetylase OafA/YrhL